jgi:hypothetical protein
MLADEVFRLKRNYCYNSTTKLYKREILPLLEFVQLVCYDDMQ